jgi:glycosyltransferase involved in cell wall biosynthesis
MKPKKVLHILNGEVFSGVEQVVFTLCKHLNPDRYQTHLILLFDGLAARRAKEMGFDVDVIPMKSRFDLRAVPKIRNICHQVHADIVHSHTIRGQFVGALATRKSNVQFIVHIHSPAIEECERTLKNRWNAFVEVWLHRWTIRYVTVADSLREHLIRKGVPVSKITTLHNAIDVNSVVEASKGMSPTIRERLQLHQDCKIIGMVALFRYRKGAQDLLNAIKILGNEPVPYRLLMIGEGEKLPGGRNYLDVLKQMTFDLSIDHRVSYVGFQENRLQWMRELDIFVLPSRFGEGLPMAVLEAMALGVPVIATPVEGTAEVLTDQITGLLPPVENPEALADALHTLLKEPDRGKQMAMEAVRVVRERHDAPIHAQRMMEIYDQILT